MIRYINTMETFTEIPDMITLCVNICDCPCHCPGCHSPFLWDTFKWTEETKKEFGEPKELNTKELEKLINNNKGFDTIAFMGGDSNVSYINVLAKFIRDNFQNLNIAWYSGRTKLPEKIINLANFDFIKLGPYIEEKGGLDNPKTNQRLYEVCRLSKLPDKFLLKDITSKFWK